MAIDKKLYLKTSRTYNTHFQTLANPKAFAHLLETRLPDVMGRPGNDNAILPYDWQPAQEGDRGTVMTFTCMGMSGARLVDMVRKALLSEIERMGVRGANRVGLIREARSVWQALEPAAFADEPLVLTISHDETDAENPSLQRFRSSNGPATVPGLLHPEKTMYVMFEGITLAEAFERSPDGTEPSLRRMGDNGMGDSASALVEWVVQSHLERTAIDLGAAFGFKATKQDK